MVTEFAAASHNGSLGMRNQNPYVFIAVLGFPVLILAVFLGPSGLDLVIHRRPPERYILPSGFTGWARIDYRQPTAPPLPVENSRRSLRLDTRGALATSDSPPQGHARDEFFAATAKGLQPFPYFGICKGGMIWGLETRTDDHNRKPS